MFIDDCNMMFAKEGSKYKRSSNRYIDAVKLFQLILKYKDVLLEPIYYNEEIMNTQFYDKIEDYDTLEYTQGSVKTQEHPKPKETKPYKVYFDFETFVRYRRDGNTHVPYLCRYETEDGVTREFIGVERGALDMLHNLPHERHILLIVHNSNYDSRFFMKYMRTMSPL